MATDCEICRRMKDGMSEANPYFVAELETGYAVLADNQYVPGYTLFISKTCVPELHELAPDRRSRFLEEMAMVAEAVFRAFEPRKLNYELLGNSVAHLHWHLIPRYADDAKPTWPIWSNEDFLSAPRVTPIEPAVLADRRQRLREALASVRAATAG
jgi:diadenosine tetraphosphate (Ap4A) HIT family hydrolase